MIEINIHIIYTYIISNYYTQINSTTTTTKISTEWRMTQHMILAYIFFDKIVIKWINEWELEKNTNEKWEEKMKNPCIHNNYIYNTYSNIHTKSTASES